MAPLLMGLLRGGPVAYKLIERFLAKNQPVGPTHAQEWSRSTPLNIQHEMGQSTGNPYVGYKEKTMMDDLGDMLIEHNKWDSDRNKMVDMLLNLQELKDAKGSMYANDFYRKSDVKDSRSVLSEALKDYTQPPPQVLLQNEGAPRTVIHSERIPARRGIWMDVLRDFKENR